MSIAPILTTLRTNNMLNSATKEFLGSNLPHIALVANKNEMVDQAINQFGNSSIVFGGGFLFDQAINKAFSTLYSQKFKKSGFRNKLAQKWFMLGKAFAIYSMVASYVISSPFLRNLITLKRTKASNFTEMVGLTQTTGNKNEAALKQKEKNYRNQFIKIWGTGLAISLGLLGTTQLLIHNKVKFPKLLETVQRFIGLPKGQYKHLKDTAAYIFWALPAYIGLYKGSRDKLEKQETIYKATGFGLAFIVLPRTLEWIANKFLKGKNFKFLGSGQNAAFLIQLLSGIVFYTSIPTIINLFKRKERAQRYGLLTPSTAITKPINPTVTPSNLNRAV